MTIDAASGLLSCPVCARPLTLGEGSAVCPERHSFDRAKQGYLNLLRSAPPANADTPAMIAARERFLGTGRYEPIAAAVSAAVEGNVLLEVGAGTGYYLAHTLDAHPLARGLASDVSVAAAKKAARAHIRMAAIVADTWVGLPVLTATVDTVLCVFAPRNLDEFHRVLVPGGRLLVVTPLPHHLAELRARFGLLDVQEHKAELLTAAAAGRFESVDSCVVERTLSLTASEAADLIAMGPNAFHAHEPDAEDGTSVTVAVQLSVFRQTE